MSVSLPFYFLVRQRFEPNLPARPACVVSDLQIRNTLSECLQSLCRLYLSWFLSPRALPDADNDLCRFHQRKSFLPFYPSTTCNPRSGKVHLRHTRQLMYSSARMRQLHQQASSSPRLLFSNQPFSLRALRA